jgi:phage shock protein A
MGIFQRISDILSANMNEMVESWEDPEMMLKQAIVEMEQSIDEAKRNVAKTMANEKVVAKELLGNQQHAEQWQARAEQAIEAGDDALAKKALTRKQEHDKVVAALLDQHSAAKEASVTLRRQLEAMQAKLVDAKRQLGTLSARKKAADVRARVQMGNLNPQLNHDAFAKFDRLRDKVEMAEAEADALRELASSTAAVDDDVFEPKASNDDLEIEAELLELKKKLRK